MSEDDQTEESVCLNCEKREGKALHTCPYKEDVCDNYKTLCNCCDECRHECAIDI